MFALDGVGGGFVVSSLVAYYFVERFGASAAVVAALFFAARLANVASHFGAAWLARRIGLVNTMVFTHIPSSFLLVAVVAPEERTSAAGATNVARLASRAIAPLVAGATMKHFALGAPLVLGATIKIIYDVLLFLAFRRLRPPEELPAR